MGREKEGEVRERREGERWGGEDGRRGEGEELVE